MTALELARAAKAMRDVCAMEAGFIPDTRPQKPLPIPEKWDGTDVWNCMTPPPSDFFACSICGGQKSGLRQGTNAVARCFKCYP